MHAVVDTLSGPCVLAGCDGRFEVDDARGRTHALQFQQRIALNIAERDLRKKTNVHGDASRPGRLQDSLLALRRLEFGGCTEAPATIVPRSSLTTDDAIAYRAFRRRPRDSAEWRPFARGLTVLSPRMRSPCCARSLRGSSATTT
ncbi:hypothetical protein BN2476_120019 [Paraburkholderia piptadeniae]|uniref:Uncharacterized protein n=1 Tax=Paraburkholderia piptadeniae TaxID=1701573 RepID=A0A1N7RQV7_9BURK|nr:hypothetical protein BN2476_120019 [Paraburkholderia piptadeniae]